MATDAKSSALSAQARRSYVEGLINAMPSMVLAIEQASRVQASVVAERGLMMRRRDLVEVLQKALPVWLSNMVAALETTMSTGLVSISRFGDLTNTERDSNMSLVDNDTIEGEILSSRLVVSIMDKVSWEFNDLCSRISALEGSS